MYTVLIAEDELLVRIGIASCVPWADMNVRVIGEATDGREALDLYLEHRPDIVITDIRMPEIDGVDLIKAIRREDEKCAIIVITNVENEQTLAEIRRYGITEVLLKATMEASDVARVVKKACMSIPDTHAVKEKSSNTDAWKKYMAGKTDTPPAVLRAAVLMYIASGEIISQHLKNILVDLFVHRFSGENRFQVLTEEKYVFLLTEEDIAPTETENILKEINSYVSAAFDVRVQFASVTGLDKSDDIRQVDEKLRTLLSLPDEDRTKVLMLNPAGLLLNERLCRARNDLRRLLPLLGEGHPIIEHARDLLSYPVLFGNTYEDLIREGNRLLKDCFDRAGQTALADLTETLCMNIENSFRTATASLRPELRKALDYISDHLSEDLSAENVCRIIGYHPTYFSRLFKDELGINYSRYIINVRISKAKEYLAQTRMTVQEIADACGFSSMAYFSTTFRETVGESPAQWRGRR